IKQLAYQRHLQGINPFTGAVSLDGSQLPQVGGHESIRPGSSSSIEDLLSYNVYRSDNGTSFDMIANVLSPTLTYTDNDVVNGTTYWYYVTAVYNEGESGPSDTVSATPIAPSEFFDDFESYAPGVQLTVQSTNWTTWSGTPGTGEDPFVSDAQAFSGSNSVVIVQNNDLVKTFGSLTSGKWKISFYVYIPTGKAGYFNTLAGFTPNPFNWAMECYFDLGGSGRLLGGSSTAVTFSWAPDTWQLVEVIVDLNNDLAEFRFNGASIHTWQWTLGASGGGSPLRLDASDLFGATANDQMYFDDYGIEEYIVGIGDDQPQIPAEFSLQQNYPNPFNPSTVIKYALKENANVTLTIYNMLGQEVKTLVSAHQAAGIKEAAWDGTNNSGAQVASGIYIYRLEANDFVASRKMLLMK
ncbi:MAG: T9SS type A sorting domain-containing protein, partial [Calditrichaceae bacterium]|nr:T9SS type A sorting domain-containing protein [Calditrichaceae bacterium]